MSEEKQARVSVLKMLAQSMADIRTGRTQPAKAAIEEIADEFSLKLKCQSAAKPSSDQKA